MQRARGSVLAGLLLAVGAGAAGAQVTPPATSGEQMPLVGSTGRFTVTPVVGLMHWDNASALANKQAAANGQFTKTKYTPTVGVTADYQLLPAVGVGLYFEAARPTTRGDYFPAALFDFGGGQPAQLSIVSQRVTTVLYGLEGTFTARMGRLDPYVSGGAGAVTVYLDPEQSNGNSSFTKGQFQLGAGVGYRVGIGAVRLDVRDYVFTGWDRNRLNLVDPTFQNTTLPVVNANPPAAKNTVHNIRIALGFSYSPRRTTEMAGGTPDEQE